MGAYARFSGIEAASRGDSASVSWYGGRVGHMSRIEHVVATYESDLATHVMIIM